MAIPMKTIEKVNMKKTVTFIETIFVYLLIITAFAHLLLNISEIYYFTSAACMVMFSGIRLNMEGKKGGKWSLHQVRYWV
ncbi:hypothetical protein E2R51_12360 [Jeotgalibacillus sp. S-D1]|uniref:hypothetical protein n=1 Tax=Jeotgalibacillus sp. S-D1 TaxID=2552189 RepID=UPI00105A47F6|nr:hypothetical protein [Jeotgalibacillus sp. S-D1]TDL31999.1 hypothetical protein E2R51_12360 [Jeotgalibacillus sp. S-D1]